MNHAASERPHAITNLTSYQAEFIETVFSPSSQRTILLRGPVGTGKSTALVAAASRLLADKPKARVLFLVPSVQRWQFAYKLREEDVPSMVVDRYAFREMLDAGSESVIWAAGTVSILSIDFAKQDDVLDSLARCNWDLVVVDEWHLTGHSRARAIETIGRNATRIVLASSTPFHDNWTETYAQEGMTVVKWDLGRILNLANEPLGVTLPQVVHEVQYALDDAESALRKTVAELSDIIADTDVAVGGWRRKSLIRYLDSSPAAIESALRQFVSRLTPLEDSEGESTCSDEVTSIAISAALSELRGRQKLVSIADRALMQIENLDRDSKLNVFGATLENITQTSCGTKRIAVITDFVSTLFYLAAKIEEYETKCRLLHGAMGVAERFQSAELFSREGGILVATRAVISEGFDMPDVRDLVLYDNPQSIVGRERLFGRFNRIGRTQRLDIYVLRQNDT